MPSTYVPPEGNKHTAKLVIVGEQPGGKEVRYRQNFVGPAGKELIEDLQAVGMVRSECYFTNVIKDLDHPLEWYISFSSRGPTLSKEGLAYVRELENELKDINDRAVIIPCGNVALYALTTRTGITKWRGSVVQSTICKNWCVPIIHPATVLPPKNVYLNKFLIQFDLKKAGEIYENGCMVLERQKFIGPTVTEAESFLQSVYELGLKGTVLDFDIEIFNDELSCIAFAISPLRSMCIPFVHSRGDYFTAIEELRIMRLIAKILEDETISKRGQNLVFDSTFLLKRYGIKSRNMHDTMIAQHTLMSEFPKGLDFIASIWTDIPYYKDEGKKFFKAGGAFETLWTYNCTDSLVTSDAHPKQMERIDRQGNRETYERGCKLIEPLAYMMEKGIKINVEEMKLRREKTENEIEEAKQELYSLCGFEINPLSPAQLKNYFYKTLGHKPYTKQGAVTTDEKALKRLSRKGVKEAALVLSIRGKTKLASTYLDVSKIDSDGRIRCSYNPVGTRFSRLSSSENIFGTGMNLQNQPHEVLELFLVDDGYVGYSMDLSQAENRIVAYAGRVLEMIEAFETGKDVHALTASMISGLPYNQIIEDDANGIYAPIGDGSKTWRFFGKKCVVGETEVLTPSGWIRIDRLDYKNVPIMQCDIYNSILSFTFIKDMYVGGCEETYELSGRNSHIIGSNNHRVPLYRTDTGKFKVVELSQIDKDPHYGIPTCGKLENNKTLLDHFEVMLLVAFQADGSFNGKGHRFNLKKERKIDRACWILDKLNISYTKTSTKEGTTLISFKGPSWLTKQFDSSLLLLGKFEINTFINEVSKWDGYEDETRREYFSTNKNNAEWIQTIAHLTGHTALIDVRKPTGISKKDLYIVNFNSRNKYATLTSQKLTKKRGDLVFGPEVESGFILVRSNGKISITGNSNHGLNYDLGYKTFSLHLEVPENDAKFLVNRYHTVYPGVRQGYHAFVQSQLRSNRTVTNLMGRKTVFFDRWGYDLFKDAYACIPQGTVGDVVNERGIEYIYYSKTPIELLMQVHDSIVFQIPLSIGWVEHARLLTDIKHSLETPLVVHGREFVIPVDTDMGLCFYKKKMKQIKANSWPSNLEELAKKLEDNYNQIKGTV